jgi:hypothetical protein
MTGFVILGVLVLIAAAAPRYGADSRPGASGARHSVGADLRAVFSWIGRRATPPVRTHR